MWFPTLLALLQVLLASNCNLDKFPSQLFLTDRIATKISIEDYVQDEYPIIYSDAAQSLRLVRTFGKINFNDTLVQGVPPMFHVKIIFGSDKFQLQSWNKTTEKLQAISQSYTMSKPQQCHFFNFQNGMLYVILIHCQNQTHHRQYHLHTPFQDRSTFDLMMESAHPQKASSIQFYILQSSSTFLIRKFQAQIIQVYEYDRSQAPFRQHDCLDKWKRDIFLSQSQLQSIIIQDFTLVQGPKGQISILMVKNYGLLFKYSDYYYYYDYWRIENEIIKRIITMKNVNTFAVVTNQNLYFLSIWPHLGDKPRIVVKQLAKISIKTLQYKQIINIGQFVIFTQELMWNSYYLHNNQIKYFSFLSQFKAQKVSIDDYQSSLPVFYKQHKLYIIEKPSISISPLMISKKIKLKSSKCEKNLTVSVLKYSQIKQIDSHQELVWRNGILLGLSNVCIGDGIEVSLQINNTIYMLSQSTIFTPNMPKNITQILNYTKINSDLYAYAVKSNKIFHFISCYKQNPCVILQTYNQSYTPELCNEARLFLFFDNYQYHQQQQLDEVKQYLYLTVIWNSTKQYMSVYTASQNKLTDYDGWQSLNFLKYMDLQIISFQPPSKPWQVCSKQTNLRISTISYCNFSFVNSWHHEVLELNPNQMGGGWESREKDDIRSGFKNICSPSNNDYQFFLYSFNDAVLQVSFFIEAKGIYIQQASTIWLNVVSKRTMCIASGLAIANGTQILIISNKLDIINRLKFNEDTSKDLISGHIVLHSKSNKLVQVYDINNGFLIDTISIEIDQIIKTKQSNTISLKNGTIIEFTYNAPLQTKIPIKDGLIVCKNEERFINFTRSIRKINDLSLPQFTLSQSLTNLSDNIWNATIRKIKGSKSKVLVDELTHFIYQTSKNSLKYAERIYRIQRQINGQDLRIQILNYYCLFQRKVNSWIYNLLITYGNYYPYYFEWNSKKVSLLSDIIYGVTNVINDKITIVSWNQSGHNFMTLSFKKSNYSDVVIDYHHCIGNTWIQNQFRLGRRIFRDQKHVYILRHEIQGWDSIYSISNSIDKNGGDFPRRRMINDSKIQIFTLFDKGLCSKEEISSINYQTLGEIKDFIVINHQNRTFFIILTSDQIIIDDYFQRANQFRMIITKPYTKIDVRNNFILFISDIDDTLLYQIIWKDSLSVGSLRLVHTLVRVNEGRILNGVIMSKAIVLASKHNLILYILGSNPILYSMEVKDIRTFQYFNQITFLVNIQYKNEDSIYIEVSQSYPDINMIEIKVLSSLEIGRYAKLIVQNQKEKKEYFRAINQQRNHQSSQLREE